MYRIYKSKLFYAIFLSILLSGGIIIYLCCIKIEKPTSTYNIEPTTKNNTVLPVPDEKYKIEISANAISIKTEQGIEIDRYTISDMQFNDQLLRINQTYYIAAQKLLLFSIYPSSRGCLNYKDIKCLEELARGRNVFVKYGGLWRYDISKKSFEHLHELRQVEKSDAVGIQDINFNMETGLFVVKFNITNANRNDAIVQIIEPTLDSKFSVIEELVNVTPEEYDQMKE